MQATGALCCSIQTTVKQQYPIHYRQSFGICVHIRMMKCACTLDNGLHIVHIIIICDLLCTHQMPGPLRLLLAAAIGAEQRITAAAGDRR